MDQYQSQNLRSLLMPSGLPRKAHPREPGLGQTSAPTSTSSGGSNPPTAAPENPKTTEPSTTTSSASRVAPHPSLLNSYLPSFFTLKVQILQDLEANLPRLLALNVSRREAVAQYLDRLSGHTPGPTTTTGSIDAAGGLRRWIEGPRSPAQNHALQAYLEEIALIVLGQAILLKAWSDRAIRAWSEADLKDLNWAMHAALKPHIPLDRENWQVARQNIYSWYKPSPLVQREIWSTLETWKLATESPIFLGNLLSLAKKACPEYVEPQGYDSRLFKAIWEKMPLFGFDPLASAGPLKRHWAVFSPTLREGAVVRTGPTTIQWIGLESSCFQIMHAELMQLWWGQSAPPLWSIGNGLEAHTRDQLTLGLGSPKPSLLSRIAEMEACDAAFVLEERAVRAQGRSAEAQRFREQIEGISYFKKLRSTGTTLGDLQACVALSKLRPGGLLWWCREEPLESRDGTEMLNFLLERGKLICEWNFSEITHSLPANAGAKPLFPKYLYLFVREPRVEERLTHRPVRLSVQGQIRSHVELPLLLEDALQSALSTSARNTPRGQWHFHSQQSPSTQKEWADRWPDPTCQNTVRFVERLREMSLPLASATTIRQTPEGDPNRNHAWSVHHSLHGFWIQAQQGPEGRRLLTQPLPRPGRETQGSGFMILVADENAIAPLMHYLESPTVQQWLDYHCERRGDRWILNEQSVRWIPVPKGLLRALGVGVGVNDPNHPEATQSTLPIPLPGDWERLAAMIATEPKIVREAVERLLDPQNPQASAGGSPSPAAVLPELFVRTARTIESLKACAGPLFNLVSTDGKIRWSELLRILPKSEVTPITLHSRVSLSGSLPLHLPIAQISPTQVPSPGILFATEAGISMKIHSDSATLLDMIWDQLEGLSSPTWSELLQYLRLPRRVEVAETTASDVLHSHGDQTRRIRELAELLAVCSVL